MWVFIRNYGKPNTSRLILFCVRVIHHMNYMHGVPFLALCCIWLQLGTGRPKCSFYALSLCRTFHRDNSEEYVVGLVQDCSISSALAMEILQSCTIPSMCWYIKGISLKLLIQTKLNKAQLRIWACAYFMGYSLLTGTYGSRGLAFVELLLRMQNYVWLADFCCQKHIHIYTLKQTYCDMHIVELVFFDEFSKQCKQGKSEGFDSCDRPNNLAQIWSKSSIYQPMWPWNLMTSKNNRAPLLYYIKLCVSFQMHRWIQTEVTLRVHSIQVEICDFLSLVTLKFDGWPWETIGHLFDTTPSFVHHFKSIGEFKLVLQSGNAQFGSKSAIFCPM